MAMNADPVFPNTVEKASATSAVETLSERTFPVSRSINLVKREILLSSFKLFHTISVNSSRSFVEIVTTVGSPSNVGSGFPSCI